MADCVEAPYGAMSFDDNIYMVDGKSTYSLVSITTKGMQTGRSFLEMLQWLRKQIDHRNHLEVSADQLERRSCMATHTVCLIARRSTG